MKPYLILAIIAFSFQFTNPCSPENRGQKPQSGDTVVEVEVLEAHFQDQAQTIKTQGTVDYSDSVDIRATSFGHIEKLHVKSGDTFLAQAPLVSLSAEETQMHIDLKLARLKEYEARLTLAQSKAENETEDAQGTTNNDVEFLDEEKMDEPVEKNEAHTPQETPQTQRALLIVLQTYIDKLKLEIEFLEKQKNQLTILAPFSGVVLQNNFIEGDEVKNQDSLMKVSQSEPLSVSFALPQESVNFVSKQSQVEVFAPHSDQSLGSGSIYFISPTLDSASQTASVKAYVSNPDFSIKTGQPVDVVIKTSKMNRILTLPESSVVKTQDKNFIFIVVGQKASLIELQDVTPKDGGFVEVKANLSVDDRIIDHPPQNLKNGDFVQINSDLPSVEKR